MSSCSKWLPGRHPCHCLRRRSLCKRPTAGITTFFHNSRTKLCVIYRRCSNRIGTWEGSCLSDSRVILAHESSLQRQSFLTSSFATMTSVSMSLVVPFFDPLVWWPHPLTKHLKYCHGLYFILFSYVCSIHVTEILCCSLMFQTCAINDLWCRFSFSPFLVGREISAREAYRLSRVRLQPRRRCFWVVVELQERDVADPRHAVVWDVILLRLNKS